MSDSITTLATRMDELRLEAQPYIEQLEQDPLHKEYIPTDHTRGLTLREESDIFSDAERQLFRGLTILSASVDETMSSLDRKRGRILDEIEAREHYADAFQASDSKPLDEALAEVTAEYDRAENVLTECNSVIEKLQRLGWIKYMDSFKTAKGKPDYGRLKKEVSQMLESIKIIDTADLLRSENAKEVFKSVPKSVLIDIETKDFTSARRGIITPTNFSAMGEEDNKEYYRMIIEPHFFYHLKAVERMKMPTAQVRGEIENALDQIIAQLKDSIITAETDATNLEKLDKIVRLPVERFSYSQAELTRNLFSGKYKNHTKNAQITIFDVGNKEEGKNPVSSFLSAYYKDLPGVMGLENLTPEQEGIYDAIASEWNAGNQLVTTRMIHKTRMGGDSSAKLTPKQTEEYNKFIESAVVTRVRIDNKEFARARGLENYPVLEDNLLNMARIQNVTMDGKVLDEVWVIKERPILNRYADSIGQSRDVDIKLLRTGTSANYMPLRDYLFKQITYMKEGNRSHRILFDTIYKNLYTNPDHKMKKRIRDNTYTMLDYWIECGYIYSYLPSEGKTKSAPEPAVTIFLEGEKAPKKAEQIRKKALK